MTSPFLQMILDAPIYDLVRETPVQGMHFLSKALHNRIQVKREDLQPIFSFKIRGAYNRMLHLTPTERARGVITASAGNHAQGVAMAAAHLDIRAFIVMPVTTPQIKVQSVRERGAQVLLHGDSFDEARVHALALAKRKKYVFVHPYDDPLVIAGQGTVGMELLRQITGPIDAIFIPVGGGGLIAGVAQYVKAVRPDIAIIGVESESSACLQAALRAKRRVTLPSVGIFADGVAVATIGKEPFRLLKKTVDDVVTVTNDEICAAIKDLFDDTRSIAEPAGALGLAGLKKYVHQQQWRGKHLVTIDSGANVNFGRLRYISQRAEIGEGREMLIAVTIPSRPGSLRKVCQLVGTHSITALNYRYSSASDAQIMLGLEIRSSGGERHKIIAQLRRAGYAADDVSDNELAKEHICFMVGGHAPTLDHEMLFRFQFPEKPGALMRFLSMLPKRWDITLFNYRYEGAAYGTVCVGLHVAPVERFQMKAFLKRLNYHVIEETGNPVYHRFVR